MNILALDLSLSSTGFVVGKCNKSSALEIGSITPPQWILDSMKLEKKFLIDFQVQISLALIQKVIQLIDTHHCTVVITESVPFVGNPKVSGMLHQLHGAVRVYLAGVKNLNVVYYSVPTIRSSIGLPKLELDKNWSEDKRRKMKKQHTLDFIRSKGFKATNFDEADACSVLLCYCNKQKGDKL